MKQTQLAGRALDRQGPPYIIAEIGVNHGGSLDLAKRLIELAKEGGADAAKFQSYKADTLASRHSPAYWDTSKEPTLSQHELFAKYDSFEAADYVALAEHCSKVGIDFLSTPFDDAAVDFLEPLVPFYKIASADLTNLPFLRRVAAKGKEVVLSTGAATLGEVDLAVEALRAAGAGQLTLLHCILNYPTADADAHLGMIRGLARAYPDLAVGYSDHTLPGEHMLPLLTAYLLGAVVLEKHFTHDKSLPGNDHYHAMDAEDLKLLRRMLAQAHELMGPSEHKEPIPGEAISRANARRSIVLKKTVAAGQVLDESCLTYKRPGTGISPLWWDEIIGRRAARALPEDHILAWADLQPRGEE